MRRRRGEKGRGGRNYKREATYRPCVDVFKTASGHCIIFSSFCHGRGRYGPIHRASHKGRAMRYLVFVTTTPTLTSSSHFNGLICSCSTTCGRRRGPRWSKQVAVRRRPTTMGRQRASAPRISRSLPVHAVCYLLRSPRGRCEFV